MALLKESKQNPKTPLKLLKKINSTCSPSLTSEDLEGWEGARLQKPEEPKKDRIPMQPLVP